jgi:hypothetical protein
MAMTIVADASVRFQTPPGALLNKSALLYLHVALVTTPAANAQDSSAVILGARPLINALLSPLIARTTTTTAVSVFVLLPTTRGVLFRKNASRSPLVARLTTIVELA